MEGKRKTQTDNSDEDRKFPLPVYAAGEDIYQKAKEEKFGEEENTGMKRKGKKRNETGEDLDVPGAELDDADERIGGEDEENNYYSLGGDDHDDLEEDRE